MKKLFHQILLVEDDAVTNYLNENLLEDMQVAEAIHAVKNAEQALAFMEKHWLSSEEEPSEPINKLLLLDIHLEDWDGFELLEQLEKLPPIHHLCLILLSVSHHPRDIAKAKRFKVDAFMEKPLTREKLEAVADKLKVCAESP